MAWEALVSAWKDTDATDTTEEYEPYIGEYIANFGQFQNTEFTVLV